MMLGVQRTGVTAAAGASCSGPVLSVEARHCHDDRSPRAGRSRVRSAAGISMQNSIVVGDPASTRPYE